MILRQDIGVSETQRHVNPAGFKDAYAYEIQKAVKRLAIKLEKILFQSTVTAATALTATSGTGRVMKSFQSFITTNTAYAGALSAVSGSIGAAGSAGQLDASDFNSMLSTIYKAGGNPEQVYVSPAVKRQISVMTVPGASTSNLTNRNIAAVDKKLVSSIDFYDSDFGLIQIVLDRWVPEGTNTSSAASAATDVSGQCFFLQRSMNRLAWLRPMQHSLVGKRGDSVAGVCVGEVTLEVLNEKANGRILSINNMKTGVSK